MKYNDKSIRMTNTLKTGTPSVGMVMEQLEFSCTAGINVKWHNHFGKKFGQFPIK